MPYVTSIERLARDEGLAEGRAEALQPAIELGLKLRFGQPGVELMPRIREIKDLSALDAIFRAIETAPDLDALRNMLPPQA